MQALAPTWPSAAAWQQSFPIYWCWRTTLAWFQLDALQHEGLRDAGCCRGASVMHVPAQWTRAAAAEQQSPWHPRSSAGRISDMAPRWPAVKRCWERRRTCAGLHRPQQAWQHTWVALWRSRKAEGLPILATSCRCPLKVWTCRTRLCPQLHTGATCAQSAGLCAHTLTRCSRMMSLMTCSLGSVSLSGAKHTICTVDAYSGWDPLPSCSSSVGSDRVKLLTQSAQ